MFWIELQFFAFRGKKGMRSRPCEKCVKPISHTVLSVSRKRHVESLHKFYIVWNKKKSLDEDTFYIPHY